MQGLKLVYSESTVGESCVGCEKKLKRHATKRAITLPGVRGAMSTDPIGGRVWRLSAPVFITNPGNFGMSEGQSRAQDTRKERQHLCKGGVRIALRTRESALKKNGWNCPEIYLQEGHESSWAKGMQQKSTARAR